jgi:hypothetical protein
MCTDLCTGTSGKSHGRGGGGETGAGTVET